MAVKIHLKLADDLQVCTFVGTPPHVAFIALSEHMETLKPLCLRSNARWAQLRSVVGSATRPVDFKSAEDEIDAIFCAHLAWLWHNDRGALQVYGSLADGYIIAPPPPTHAPAKAAKLGKGSALHSVASSTVVDV